MRIDLQRVGPIHQAHIEPGDLTVFVGPHAARWDYGIGLAENDLSVIWVEVHPAETSEVAAIVQKLVWLQQVLSRAPEALREKSERFCWGASGRINIPRHTHHYKRLRQTRIEEPLKSLKI